ncbi:chaperone modulator CbpM [Pararhodonellum marinum]|uniref:chaperone modulator CbpM n=1 Tax=Pararhodonellum marinum TaxID=2755358 RepID=UPI00188F4291|nr:chaperone modulator CbpM [Pararhodonellum marinum]
MKKTEMITIQTFCTYHGVEDSLIYRLEEVGLINVYEIEEQKYLEEDKLSELERLVRIYKDLGLSPEGIDVVVQLLEKIDRLQQENNYLLQKIRRLDQ